MYKLLAILEGGGKIYSRIRNACIVGRKNGPSTLKKIITHTFFGDLDFQHSHIFLQSDLE